MINQTDTDIRTNDVKFKQIYNGLFIESGKNHKKNQIGAFQIPEDCLTELLEITSLLSDYAGYNYHKNGTKQSLYEHYFYPHKFYKSA